MDKRDLLGTTTENSIAIPLDRLGAAGVQGELIVKAMFAHRNNDDPIRFDDRSERRFEVKAKLSRSPPDTFDWNGSFDRTHGSSFIMASGEISHFELKIPESLIRLDVNEKRQVSMASAEISAISANEARQRFLTALSRYLDRMSYLAGIPTHVALVVVRDTMHEVQYFSFISPPRDTSIEPGDETLSADMQPVYALYREAMNSSSPYYRVLCFHKIMEGLLGPLRVSLRKRAKLASLDLPNIKDRAPDHPDFPQGLRSHVGTPTKEFYDKFLSNQYRDAMAHFTLKQSVALDVSSPEYFSRFVDVAFAADLCTRALTQAHERNLRLVLAAEQ